MQVTLYMAMSIDAVIARPGGDEDFLSHDNWKIFCDLARSRGCFVIGRKTFEAVQEWDDYGFDDLVGLTKIVVSGNSEYSLPETYFKVDSPAAAILASFCMSKSCNSNALCWFLKSKNTLNKS